MPHRKGVTLLELLVVLAIFGVVIALVLPAVQRAREAASRSASQNNLRQVVLAMQSFAAGHNGRVPNIEGNIPDPTIQVSFFGALYDYLEDTERVFVSPADPTVLPQVRGASSYAVNGQVFKGSPSLPGSVPDGTSYTICLAEHYSTNCQVATFMWGLTLAGGPVRRATFADQEAGDIVPVTAGSPPTSGPSVPGWTFQVAPMPATSQCFPLVAQTPHPAGMLVAMIDGSGHVISSTVAPSIYWGQVTPRGGESLDD
jgi:prepilin-type N-terminal cleavage/methylation domain-containing protein